MPGGVASTSHSSRSTVRSTAAKIGSVEGWNARIGQVHADGLAPLATATAERWFTPRFNAEHADAVAHILERFLAVSLDGHSGCCAALAGADLRNDIERIANPLLAISGTDDPVCTPSDLQFIADGVVDGRHVTSPAGTS